MPGRRKEKSLSGVLVIMNDCKCGWNLKLRKEAERVKWGTEEVREVKSHTRHESRRKTEGEIYDVKSNIGRWEGRSYQNILYVIFCMPIKII